MIMIGRESGPPPAGGDDPDGGPEPAQVGPDREPAEPHRRQALEHHGAAEHPVQGQLDGDGQPGDHQVPDRAGQRAQAGGGQN